MHSLSIFCIFIVLICYVTGADDDKIDSPEKLEEKVKPYPDRTSPNSDNGKNQPKKFPNSNKHDSKDKNNPLDEEDENGDDKNEEDADEE